MYMRKNKVASNRSLKHLGQNGVRLPMGGYWRHWSQSSWPHLEGWFWVIWETNSEPQVRHVHVRRMWNWFLKKSLPAFRAGVENETEGKPAISATPSVRWGNGTERNSTWMFYVLKVWKKRYRSKVKWLFWSEFLKITQHKYLTWQNDWIWNAYCSLRCWRSKEGEKPSS